MPRTARKKDYNAIFHIMSRSISEVDLFKDDGDKIKYLSLVKKYQKLYRFKVYGYCLMDNHTHFIIDANGADISRIMHSINFSYAQYFNRRHKRHGHLFQDRFKSKMVGKEKYLYTLSAYIHNNATQLPCFEACPEEYVYSTLGIYLGLRKDQFKIVDEDFIMSFFGKDVKASRERYKEWVFRCDDKKIKEDIEFEDEKTEYRSCRKMLVRNATSEEVVGFVVEKMSIKRAQLIAKHTRQLVEAKALLVVLMRSLCNFRSSEICNVLGNISQARISKLSSIGIGLIGAGDKYQGIINEFLGAYSA